MKEILFQSKRRTFCVDSEMVTFTNRTFKKRFVVISSATNRERWEIPRAYSRDVIIRMTVVAMKQERRLPSCRPYRRFTLVHP